MEFKIALEVSLSAETLTVLKSFVGGAPAKAAEVKEPKAAKEKAAPAAAKEVKAEDNGTAEKKAIDLSTIRQFVAKSEVNKAAARSLFKKYETTALSELDEKHYEAFYNDLVNGAKDDL